ncbi:bifunctional tetrahydrofolate synthase/dihydrofolate synthase [Shewanella maritima]|uniref:bifunctional tetrahydrofolate synthase/dihydrofolate synthase n=1 Tax=Shewanella maritima TaxID=2520507 RepID=UPI001F5FE7F4|nr:bifunctional tetrahydrofolate synthase/dihydrofolate synthase [Shewanella maritima]
MSTSAKQTIDLTSASLNDWLEHLLAIHPAEIDMGLGRVSQVASKLGIDKLPNSQVITVAGTNGKGTTCAMLESILRQAGKSVGVYSSPHINHFNERIRVNQQDVSDELIIEAFQAIEQARGDITITYFEFATLAGLYVFGKTQPNVVLLEVGLGGRLDATNLIDSDATIITAIDLDHQEYLGDTREDVGREKAGVMRANCLSIIGEPDLPESVMAVAKDIGSLVRRVGHDFSYQLNEVNPGETLPYDERRLNDGHSWRFSSASAEYHQLPVPSLPLPNAASALALISEFWPEITFEQITQGFAKATLSGRIEQVSEQPVILLDVAHNPHAARYLAAQLQRYQAQGMNIRAICGMLKDKDIASVLACFDGVISHWDMVSLDNPRGATANELTAALQSCDLKQQVSLNQFDSMELAWQSMVTSVSSSDSQANELIIVFGSFFTVAAFQACFQSMP